MSTVRSFTTLWEHNNSLSPWCSFSFMETLFNTLCACGTLFGHSKNFKSCSFTFYFPVLQSVVNGKTFTLFNQRQCYFFKRLWETLSKAFWKSKYVTASLCSLKVSGFLGNTLSTNATLTHSHCIMIILVCVFMVSMVQGSPWCPDFSH